MKKETSANFFKIKLNTEFRTLEMPPIYAAIYKIDAILFE